MSSTVGTSSLKVGAKRKRSEMSTSAPPDSPSVKPIVGAAVVPAAEPRKVKAWKKDTAGAKASADGKYVHRWDEHRRESSRDDFKYGKWTVEEDKLLLEAYDEYCITHHLEGDDRLKTVLDSIVGTTYHDCWIELASNFKNRTVRAVLRRAIRLLHPGNFRGDWDDADYRLLSALVSTHGTRWKEIGRLMNRLPNSVRNTYYRITAAGGDEVASGVWSAAEEAALVALVKKYGKPTSSGWLVDIPWTAVASQLGSRSVQQCLQKWNGSFGAKALGVHWDKTSEKALIDAVYEDGGETREEVYWDRLIPGRPAVECRRHFDALCKRVAHHAQKSFSACLEALKHEYDLDERREASSFAALYEHRTGRSADGSTVPPSLLDSSSEDEAAGAISAPSTACPQPPKASKLLSTELSDEEGHLRGFAKKKKGRNPSRSS